MRDRAAPRTVGRPIPTSTVKITVNPVNDAPVAADDSFTTAEDTRVRQRQRVGQRQRR
ncbi:hypothetical protein [Bradyrhizobium zhanjiangense]|uniref:hypothetical protein n=1 Tax=Bradyrhizobium zhanjiangense TaxID=1325107 RepID=UPI003B84B526